MFGRNGPKTENDNEMFVHGGDPDPDPDPDSVFGAVESNRCGLASQETQLVQKLSA